MLAAGCNEDFSPKVPSGNRYYLFCIVSATPLGGSVQVALVDRMYDVPGLNPAVNREDPFVAGARITLSVRGTQSPFTYASEYRSDTSRYHTPVQYYIAKGISVVANDAVTVQATLPDSTRLSASTQIPGFRPTDSAPDFTMGVTTLLDRENVGTAWILDWSNDVADDHLFFPSLTLVYSTTTDSGISVQHTVPVPLKYVEHNGQWTPVYPAPQTEAFLAVDFDALDRLMRGLGEGIADKSTVHPQQITFGLVEYDIALSRYYGSVKGYQDQFSVRLDERTYTNVQGGDGIVGSSYTQSRAFRIGRIYAASFGYKVE
jgi:hypothetical protein